MRAIFLICVLYAGVAQAMYQQPTSMYSSSEIVVPAASVIDEPLSVHCGHLGYESEEGCEGRLALLEATVSQEVTKDLLLPTAAKILRFMVGDLPREDVSVVSSEISKRWIELAFDDNKPDAETIMYGALGLLLLLILCLWFYFKPFLPREVRKRYI